MSPNIADIAKTHLLRAVQISMEDDESGGVRACQTGDTLGGYQRATRTTPPVPRAENGVAGAGWGLGPNKQQLHRARHVMSLPTNEYK